MQNSAYTFNILLVSQNISGDRKSFIPRTSRFGVFDEAEFNLIFRKSGHSFFLIDQANLDCKKPMRA